MARRCGITGKGVLTGNNVSHANNKTKKRTLPNLQRVRINDNGTPRRVYVCTRCLKAGKVVKQVTAVASYRWKSRTLRRSVHGTVEIQLDTSRIRRRLDS